MALLSTILKNLKILSQKGNSVTTITDLQIDSRKVKPGSCFIAIKGNVLDGHTHIDDAINKGATVIICENIPSSINEEIQYIAVEDSAKVAGALASNFYNNPSEKLKLVGITGTNGKTTVATLLYKLFTALGHQCGLISTVKNVIGDDTIPSTHTTPDPISLNELLHKMVESGCTYAFMEVSSHAIHQHRIEGLTFAGGIFTNITHDHLDYHKTFDEYIRVKKSFFDQLMPRSFAITNADDKRGLVMLQNTKAHKYTYSLKTLADSKGKILENSLLGLLMTINDIEVHFKLIGTFNAYNLLAVYSAATCLGQDKNTVLQFLSNLSGAEGRFEYITSAKENIIGIIDYAHTPDALLNVLATIKNLREKNEQIITVVGCGGDRDRTKRPLMAEVCCEHSDKVIFTADNPRSEDPLQIIKEMEAGVNISFKKKYLTIPDRKDAIKTAVTLANKDDIILVAGKGHEKYQEIKGVKYPFDDRSVLKEMFELIEK
jgi:UDP-N-acetylmuramoyl-L-alanyl-D-glutamate--2,6-diaminopimelate ligase